MNVAAYVEALQQDLANVAGIGDEAIAEAAGRIAAALESALRLRLMDALGEAAAELTNQLPDGHVEVRVADKLRDDEPVQHAFEQTIHNREKILSNPRFFIGAR